MAYEHQEHLYENVAYNNSQIIDLPYATRNLTLTTTADSTLFRLEDSCIASKSTQPRLSLLEAFDPVLQRKSLYTAKTRQSELLNQLSEIDFSYPNNTPPPLPKTYTNFEVDHLYEPIENGTVQFQLPTENVSAPLHLDREESSDGDSHSNEEETEFTACPSMPTNTTPKPKFKGLVSKVTKLTWLKLPSTNVLQSKDPVQADHSHIKMTPPIIGVGHAGMISWTIGGKKRDPQKLWTEVKNGRLSAYADQTTSAPLHVIKLEKLLSIGLLSSAENSLDFEVVTTIDKSKIVLSLSTKEERIKWMDWILENACGEVFSSELRKCFTRSGRVYIKDGVTGDWQVAWLLVQSDCKKLWVKKITGQIICEDLRKVHSVSQLSDGGGSSNALQPGSPIIIHWSDHTCYIQSDLKTETEAWYCLSRLVALQSGTALEDHQLTADDVPVLVECCIKFIETYGMLTEGIYRRSGIQSKINELLVELRVDVWNVHISREEYTEHDVANVLKRFLRTLPEPLLTNELYSKWIEGIDLQSHELRLDLYKRLIGALPHVNQRILRKLLGHLHAIQNKCEKNGMSVSNLAAIWGPTLMTVESARDHNSNFRYS